MISDMDKFIELGVTVKMMELVIRQAHRSEGVADCMVKRNSLDKVDAFHLVRLN
jgi:hypothetical protein